MSDMREALLNVLALGSRTSRELEAYVAKFVGQGSCFEEMMRLQREGMVETNHDFKWILTALMMDKLKPIRGGNTVTHTVGEFIALSSGEYSDYRFNGLYRVLVDLDLGHLAEDYSAQAPLRWLDQPRTEENLDASDDGFGAWMILKELVEPVDYDEIHCGSYHFEVSSIEDGVKARRKHVPETNFGNIM